MDRAKLFTIGAALLMSVSSAIADESNSTSNTTPMTPPDQAEFNALDTNHDGYVSRAEAEQGGMTDYSGADRNNQTQ